jgi:hypothetical protein
MKTFKRICIKEQTFGYGVFTETLERGKEYITSAEDPEDHTITVFASSWIRKVPVGIFAAAIPFTEE